MSKITQKKKKKTLPILLFDIFLNISFLGFIAAIGFFIYTYTQLPPLDVHSMIRPNDSYVFDKNNNRIGMISRKKENQENITYNQLNQSLINTLLGTEDATYFKHPGVDIISTIESTLKSVSGTSKSGGSSITQQIIGWSHLDRNEKSISRKAREILLALQAEKVVDKQNVMEMYFNYFFYGKNNIHGVEKASEFFFDRHAYELDVAQAALMTGTLNSPSTYNPLGTYDNTTKRNINYSKNRLDNVLLASKNQGYIPDSEYHLVQQVQVKDTVKIKNDTKTDQYSAYIDLVKEEMEEKYKVDFTKTSTKIYTNLDPKAQKHADKIIKGKINPLPEKDMDFGFVLTKTQTGEISAVGGGKRYKKGGIGLLNNATKLKQQPGSAFKPIIDYSPTFEFLHWSSNQVISNAPMNYPGSSTSIRNFDDKSGGNLTIPQALANSRNLTAIRAMEAVVNKVGLKGLNQYLTDLGFNFTDAELGYAYGLGGTDTGVSPAQMTGAYQAFGNGGKYIEPWTIRYYDNQETNKRVNRPTKPVQGIDEKTAFMMSNALEQSTRSSILLSAVNGMNGAPYSAKTGTTDWGSAGLRYGIPPTSQKDSWLAGYTDRYTMAVWTGFTPKGVKRGKYPSWGREHDYAAEIFGSIMRKMINGKEKSYLEMKPPQGIVPSNATTTTGSGKKARVVSTGGYAYADNNESQFDPNNLPEISASYQNNSLQVNFTDQSVTGLTEVVKIGSSTTYHGSGSFPISEGQHFLVYYSYEGFPYNEQRGCIKNKKLTTECDTD